MHKVSFAKQDLFCILYTEFQAKLFQSPDVDRFRAANGSKVAMEGVANIVLGFSMLNTKTGKSSWKTATLQAMVGNTNHNILSTTALCRSGWQFSQWDGGAELRHCATGDVISEIIEHSGCPWVRMHPSSGEADVVEPNVSLRSGLSPIQISPLSPAFSPLGVGFAEDRKWWKLNPITSKYLRRYLDPQHLPSKHRTSAGMTGRLYR